MLNMHCNLSFFFQHCIIQSNCTLIATINASTVRFDIRDLSAKYDKTEDDLKALQNVGQIIAEILKQLDSDRFIVKASNGVSLESLV